jgi:hypothetical protein
MTMVAVNQHYCLHLYGWQSILSLIHMNTNEKSQVLPRVIRYS